MINKIADSVAESLDGTAGGATVLIGGFGTAGIPNELIQGLIERGPHDLTEVNNNAVNGEGGLANRLKSGRLRKITCSFPRQAASHAIDALYPSTGIGCVKRVYTDLATFDCTTQGLRLIDAVGWIDGDELQAILGLPFSVDPEAAAQTYLCPPHQTVTPRDQYAKLRVLDWRQQGVRGG